MMSINTKIQPLIEDVGRIVPGTFLKSTDYKRWLVERDLDDVWAQIYGQVKANRNYFAMGYDHEAADSKDALNTLLNLIFEQNKDRLPDFLVDLLSFYAYQETAYKRCQPSDKARTHRTSHSDVLHRRCQ